MGRGVALWLSLACALGCRTEAREPVVDRSSNAEQTARSRSLVPTLAEERAHERASLEASLARTLMSLEGVLDARVHLVLPHGQRQLDEPEARPRASVVLRREAGTAPLDERRAAALVAGAVDNLDAALVTIVQDVAAPIEPPRPQLVHVGPIAVAATSAQPLRLLLGGLLALNLVLAVGLIALLRRLRP